MGRAEYLHGCVRVLVEPAELKDGKPIDGVWLDEGRLGTVDAGTTGGPRPDPSRAADSPR